MLVFVAAAIASDNLSPTGLAPGFGPLLVGFLVWSIGLSLGGPTGYAINPARDLGPRLAHALLPIAGKGSSDWSYAPVPIVGPLLGAVLAGLAVADGLHEATDAVAAHLGVGAIGVHEAHRAVRVRTGDRGAEEDEPVGRTHHRVGAEFGRPRRERRGEGVVSAHVDHEEGVLGGVEVVDRDRHVAPHHASNAGATSEISLGAANQVIRGSRRNHMR